MRESVVLYNIYLPLVGRYNRELKMRILKTHPLLSIVNGMLIDLPAPSNLSYF